MLKGVGIPEYYNGADVELNDKTKKWSMFAKTYIKNVTERIEGLLEIKLKCYGSPMITDDHPELDESELLVGKEISIYQMLIGCAQWAITLGRFDIQFATNTMARYASMPREGHIKRCIRIFGYPKYNAKGRILFDPTDPNYDDIDFPGHNDWTDLYPDAMEAIPEEAPTSKNKKLLKLTVIVDASHASDMITRRSVTGYLLFIGITPIKWYSKRQNTVETSTYGSELVAMRIALEALLDLRYTLRMLGIAFEETSTVLSDNQSIIVNTQLPTSNLKKKYNAVLHIINAGKLLQPVSFGQAILMEYATLPISKPSRWLLQITTSTCMNSYLDACMIRKRIPLIKGSRRELPLTMVTRVQVNDDL
jgi:hypothetical protein